jgi:hypothetical protein
MSTPGSDEAPERVEVRPVVMSRIGWTCAVVVFVVFEIVAVIMPAANAGAVFTTQDQVATGIIGVILAGLFLMLTRPRLSADRQAVRLRSFLGGWRTVPWDLVQGVDFPRKVRFARLVLPAEETLAIYAIQRLDRERAVTAMQELRALFAATHPAR